MRGRKRTPTKLAELKGVPARKLRGRSEPKPRIARPPMPEGLSAAAKRHWKAVIEEALRIGLCTTLDWTIFHMYIRAWDTVLELEAEVKRLGYYCETAKGGWKTAPWNAALIQHQMLLKAILTELGFTPASRSKASTVDPGEAQRGELLAFDGGKK